MSEYIYGTDGHEGHWLTGEEIVRCRDCDYLDTMKCPIKRALVYDGIDESACVAPGGFCAWGERK